jgi:DNA mismatch endonuclease (patch repair protein)
LNDAGIGSPIPSSPAVSARMSRLPNKDTALELAVRRRLHRMGLRYRVHVPVPGYKRRTIDIVFGPAKVAVFLDSCFWHGCDLHGTTPRSNTEWWRHKISGNKARDAQTDSILSQLGWLVMRFWAHEPTEAITEAIAVEVRSRRLSRTETGGSSRFAQASPCQPGGSGG